MGNVLEYFIKFTSNVGQVMKNAASAVGDFTSKVTAKFRSAGKPMDDFADKFIRVEKVMDNVENALRTFSFADDEAIGETMDGLVKRLEQFNKTGEGFTELSQWLAGELKKLGLNATQAASAVRMLERNLIRTGTSGKAVATDLRGGFRAIHGALGVLNGNFYGLGTAIASVIGSIKKLKLSATAITAISMGVFAVIEVVRTVVGWWKKWKEKVEELKSLRFDKHLKDITYGLDEIAKAMERNEKSLDYDIERKKKMIDQNTKLLEQELELARLREIEGKTGAERDSINADYEGQKSLLRAKAAIEKAKVEMEGEEERANFLQTYLDNLLQSKAKLETELAAANKRMKDAEAEHAEYLKRYRVNSGIIGGAVITRGLTDEEKAKRQEDWMLTDESYKKLVGQRDKIKSTLEGVAKTYEDTSWKITHAIDKANDAMVEIEETIDDHNLGEWARAEEEMTEYYDELARLEEEETRRRERENEERVKAEETIHRQKLKNAQEEARALMQMQNSAEARVNAAKSAVDEAWGLYKDPQRLAAQAKEWEADAKAREQYERDFQSLVHGRRADEWKAALRLQKKGDTEGLANLMNEWRTRGTLSVQEEATMRVGLAKAEEKAATDALKDIKAATERAVTALEAIEDAVVTAEGDY